VSFSSINETYRFSSLETHSLLISGIRPVHPRKHSLKTFITVAAPVVTDVAVVCLPCKLYFLSFAPPSPVTPRKRCHSSSYLARVLCSNERTCHEPTQFGTGHDIFGWIVFGNQHRVFTGGRIHLLRLVLPKRTIIWHSATFRGTRSFRPAVSRLKNRPTTIPRGFTQMRPRPSRNHPT